MPVHHGSSFLHLVQYRTNPQMLMAREERPIYGGHTPPRKEIEKARARWRAEIRKRAPMGVFALSDIRDEWASVGEQLGIEDAYAEIDAAVRETGPVQGTVELPSVQPDVAGLARVLERAGWTVGRDPEYDLIVCRRGTGAWREMTELERDRMMTDCEAVAKLPGGEPWHVRSRARERRLLNVLSVRRPIENGVEDSQIVLGVAEWLLTARGGGYRLGEIAAKAKVINRYQVGDRLEKHVERDCKIALRRAGWCWRSVRLGKRPGWRWVPPSGPRAVCLKPSTFVRAGVADG